MIKDNNDRNDKGNLKEITAVFLKLGLTAFGGPAAHISMMEEELVSKRKWTDEKTFLDIIGLTGLLPGPNSTETAIMMGYLRGGVPGLFAAGINFIFPAMAAVMVLASVYMRLGKLPSFQSVTLWITPVIIAIICVAFIKFYRKTVKACLQIFLVALSAVLAFLGVNEILILFGLGIISVIIRRLKDKGLRLNSIGIIPLLLISDKVRASELFLIFLKIGSVLYGSGYVLVAFLENELVRNRGLLTMKQLLDSVAAGQVTPGPVFTTATFVGYILGGPLGSAASTIGIFLPSFILILILKDFLKKMQESVLLRDFLNGINMASLGLMLWVIIRLLIQLYGTPYFYILFLASLFLLLKTKINASWLIGASLIAGIFANMIQRV